MLLLPSATGAFSAATLPFTSRAGCRSPSVLLLVIGLVAFGLFLTSPQVFAQIPLPKVTIEPTSPEQPSDMAKPLQLLVLLTVLSVAPSILIMTTSFTRIVIVLSFVRRAIATQSMPSNQIITGLSLFLTFFTMGPTWTRVNREALQPYFAGEIQAEVVQEESETGETRTRTVPAWQVAFERVMVPMRDFMFGQTREKDIALFIALSKTERPRTKVDVPTYALIPAFIVSELTRAFQIGFVIFLPFLVIDMVTASILMSMGMMMLPPIMISLPFKLLLFIMVDGWNVLIRALGTSFG